MSLMDNVKQLDSKQKGMLIATIGCIGLVIYLAYSTFFSGSSAPPAPAQPSSPPSPSMTMASAPPSVNTTTQPSITPLGNVPANETTSTTSSSAQGVGGQNLQVGHEAPPSPQNLALLAESQQMQQQYIQLVNEYQLAQLQQKLAQVDSQIAASKLTTTKSLVELKKLQPLLGSELGNQVTTGTGASTASASNAGYQAMYVGAVAGKWQAMLENAGQYYQVTVGMRLPDGSVVSQINNRGIVLTNASGTAVFLPMTKNID